jgi:hypothetical protein
MSDYAKEIIDKLGKPYRTKPTAPQIIRAYKNADGDYLAEINGAIAVIPKEKFEAEYEIHAPRGPRAKKAVPA